MKRSLFAAALCTCTLLTTAAVAQDKPMGGGAPPDMKAMEEAMMKAATPGPNHKILDRAVGDFTYTNKLWMAPGAPPMEMTGTSHAEWVLGGRYVQGTIKGEMGGMPFEGRSTDGYDNVLKMYVNSWVDNLGTGIMTGTGNCDASGKVCTMNLEGSDPMSGGTTKSKSVTTYTDNGYKLEMFMMGPDGKEMKIMELVATRKK
jgi:hypothetical protein